MKNEILHPERNSALMAYVSKRNAWNKASRGTDEACFLRADAEYKKASKFLVEMEMKHPTASELSKRNASRERSNRGLLD